MAVGRPAVSTLVGREEVVGERNCDVIDPIASLDYTAACPFWVWAIRNRWSRYMSISIVQTEPGYGHMHTRRLRRFGKRPLGRLVDRTGF